MEQQPLENEMIQITSIELKEKKRKDGTTWKDFDVRVENQMKGIYYTLPIKKADGEFTRAYEFYKKMKGEWEDIFISNGSVAVEIAYSEKESAWKTKEGKEMKSTYRTIRMMREPEGEVQMKQIPSMRKTDIDDIEF